MKIKDDYDELAEAWEFLKQDLAKRKFFKWLIGLDPLIKLSIQIACLITLAFIFVFCEQH